MLERDAKEKEDQAKTSTKTVAEQAQALAKLQKGLDEARWEASGAKRKVSQLEHELSIMEERCERLVRDNESLKKVEKNMGSFLKSMMADKALSLSSTSSSSSSSSSLSSHPHHLLHLLHPPYVTSNCSPIIICKRKHWRATFNVACLELAASKTELRVAHVCKSKFNARVGWVGKL